MCEVSAFFAAPCTEIAEALVEMQEVGRPCGVGDSENLSTLGRARARTVQIFGALRQNQSLLPEPPPVPVGKSSATRAKRVWPGAELSNPTICW